MAQTKLTKAQSTKVAGFETTSAKIRYLASLDMSRGDIGRFLKIRYQWVRNVLIQDVKTPKEQI